MSQRPVTESLARGATRHPVVVLAIWGAAFVAGIVIIAVYLGSALTTEQNFVNDPEAQRGFELIEGTSLEGATADETVFVRSSQATVQDAAFRRRVESLTAEIAALEDVVTVANVYAVGDPTLASADGRTTIIPVFYRQVEDLDDIDVGPLVALAEARDGQGGFEVGLSGVFSLDQDFQEIAERDLRTGETIGIAVALVVLLLVFGAVVASLMPIVLAIVGIVVALAITALIGQMWEFSFFVTNMVVMIGLAVGIDYSLFIVSRFREERAAHHSVQDAIARAGATSSKAMLFSGITVVIALIGMLLIPVVIFISLAAGAIIVVIVSVAQALTLLPASLALLGDRVNALRIPFFGRRIGAEAGADGVWAAISGAVMRRPAVSLIASAAVLLLAASPVLTMDTGFNGLSALPDSAATKRGFEVLDQEFNAGQNQPVQTVVSAEDTTTPQIQAAIADLERRMEADGAFGRSGVDRTEDLALALVSAPVAFDPNSRPAYDAVDRLREIHIPAAFTGVDAEVLVTGVSAGDFDFIQLTERYFPIVIALVLALSFILLTVAFRSIVVPVKSIVMNLLSVGAAYGLMVAVFQHGLGNEILGFTQVEVIEAWIPLFLFSVLFGLSMDYQVFLVSRIQERYRKTGDNRDAVYQGVGTTARLITGAALIMVAVFAGFALGDLVMFQQMGFGLAVAVLIDATIVRSVLVPATMVLLDRWNWYLPPFLDWMPDIAVEGESRPVAR
jgi:RND superfamily putative drug exporter